MLFSWRVVRSGYPIACAQLPHCGEVGRELVKLLDIVGGECMKKPVDRKVTGGSTPLMGDATFQKRFPTVWEYMTATAYEDGSKRETSSVILFVADGTWKIMLRDKDAGLCLWVAVRQPSQVWEALEAAVSDASTEWRVDRQQPGQAAKRVKRTP